MINDLEQLLSLEVHALLLVRDRNEAAALFNSLKQQLRTGKPLLPGSKTLHGEHSMCKKVSDICEDILQRNRGGFSKAARDERKQAKAIVVSEDQSDSFVSFQFVNGTHEELEAHESVLDLRRGAIQMQVWVDTSILVIQSQYNNMVIQVQYSKVMQLVQTYVQMTFG